MARFIDSYGFYSTSDQAYSHSERALCLALSENFGDVDLSNFVNNTTIDLCIQIRNLNRMCGNCEHFILGRDIYFTTFMERGCFVTRSYKDDYESASCTILSKRNFIKKYISALRLDLSNEDIDALEEYDLNDLFNQIIPKDISELIRYRNTLFLESMNVGTLSEVVKIYLS